MIRPDGEPEKMRHDDADEADRARHRDRRSGEERHGDDGDTLQELHLDAEIAGFRLAQRQGIEATGEAARQRQAERDEGKDGDDLLPARAAEAAEAAPAGDPLATSPTADGGTDAWSSARDWADNSAVPSTSDTSEAADLHTDHLGGDLPADGDTTA